MGIERGASSSFIIATKNRPDDLLRTVESLMDQTVLPAQLCIVDASDLAPQRARIEAICERAGVRVDYHHPAPPGLPRQRNLGIDRTTGDPVFFIDDDVLLDPTCHQEVLAEYERWGPELGGVRVAPARPERPYWHMRVFRRLFCLGGWWPDAPAKVTRGFFVRGPSDSTDAREVYCFKGYFMSFRREVFDLERFDETLDGYAWKEDFDFTFRVSRRYKLVQTPRARCDHVKSGSSRMNPHHLERMKMANQFYLHRKLFPQTRSYRVALWWALVGLFFYDIFVGVRRLEPRMLSGLIAGIWDHLNGRGLVEPPKAGERIRAEMIAVEQK